MHPCKFLAPLILFACPLGAEPPPTLSEARLREGVAGYWIGQLAGNYLGLPFENLYVDEPLPRLIERYYSHADVAETGLRMNLEDRRAYLPILADALGGAWSDDDSDIEFVYLHAVEEHGLDLSYAQLTDAWRRHINRFIWGANRRARDLMEQGLIAPATGQRAHNSEWYRLSAQLTTEIWGVFHPGMPALGGEKAAWCSRIAADEWAVDMNRFYGTLFSAAFLESDIPQLIARGQASLPPESPMRRGIEDLQGWHRAGLDWREARARLHADYFREIDGFVIPDPVAGSIINGLCSVLALLWGEGDWLRTVALATSAGYDCDNQAATCGALLGLIHGPDAIPRHLTHELPSRGRWSEPFNNTYINYSRDGLPAFQRNDEIIERIITVAIASIHHHGGQRLDSAPEPTFRLPTEPR